MYTEHFGLSEKPFSISPDPRYLYLSQRHADALAHLLYGISESGGFIQLTGEVGTGKTTLIRSLLEQLPDETDIALILNPQLSSKQFLQAICQELQLDYTQRDTARALIERLNEELLNRHSANRRVVLIVDEAQTMSAELIEQVRLLTNLETSRQKLLQIILIGQPELRELLAQQQMRQVAQRITGRYHLEPLTAEDASIYVNHRMKVAGSRPEVFSAAAIRQLFRLSRGVPRLINVIADRALLAAYTRDQTRIDARLVRQAAAEVFGQETRRRWWPGLAAAAVFIALLLFAFSLGDPGTPTPELALLSAPQAAAGDARGSGNNQPTPTQSPLASSQPESESESDPGTGSLIDLQSLLDGSESLASFAALAQLWGTGPFDSAADCTSAAAAAGLRCYTSAQISLADIEVMNHPAVIELGADNDRRHAFLRGLDGGKAELVINDSTHVVPTEELLKLDPELSALLWRPAVTATDWPLQAGAEGAGVIWLRVTLNSIGFDSPAGPQPQVFTGALAEALASYQTARGIEADGRASDQTLIRLQAEIGLVDYSLRRGSY